MHHGDRYGCASSAGERLWLSGTAGLVCGSAAVATPLAPRSAHPLAPAQRRDPYALAGSVGGRDQCTTT
eukprot:gene9017-biopygen2472